jgi:hypothetical protein
MGKIQAAGALAPEPLLLSDENSLWGADVYIAVAKEVPGSEMARVSGTFLTRVFEGPYQNVRRWVEEMTAYVTSKQKQLKRLYFFYTTCPKCAKYYGKNCRSPVRFDHASPVPPLGSVLQDTATRSNVR